MKNLEAVRAAIIKAVPEIVELKFGCEIVIDFGEWENVIVLSECMKCSKHKTNKGCEGFERRSGDNCHDVGNMEEAVDVYGGEEMEGFWNLVVEKKRIKEIVGRPIRLADVLLAVQFYDLPDGYMFFNANWRGNVELSGLAGQKFTPWNLRNDDLSQQSEECIEFLARLLTT
jgi:hypothetical protein